MCIVTGLMPVKTLIQIRYLGSARLIKLLDRRLVTGGLCVERAILSRFVVYVQKSWVFAWDSL